MVPRVACELRRSVPHLGFRFVMTLPMDSMIWQTILREAAQLRVTPYIENRGPVAHHDGPQLYRECQASFLPTVLETFSASYPEAMAMCLPIVTTDLDFARDVCGDAALYFRPGDVHQAAAHLIRALTDSQRRSELVQAGQQRLRSLPTAQRQYYHQVDLLEALVEGRFEQVAEGSLPTT